MTTVKKTKVVKKATPVKKKRKEPGSTGKGKFYHIELRPKSDFVFFHTQDVGKKGGLERVAGRRKSGSWATVTWLVSKDDAHIEGKTLIIDDKKAKTVLKQIDGKITWKRGDIFKAKPVKNVAEKDKPTVAQKRAWNENIKKAQAVRRKKAKA